MNKRQIQKPLQCKSQGDCAIIPVRSHRKPLLRQTTRLGLRLLALTDRQKFSQQRHRRGRQCPVCTDCLRLLSSSNASEVRFFETAVVDCKSYSLSSYCTELFPPPTDKGTRILLVQRMQRRTHCTVATKEPLPPLTAAVQEKPTTQELLHDFSK